MIRKALQCALTALSLASLSTLTYGQDTKPNIVVVLADDLGLRMPILPDKLSVSKPVIRRMSVER